MGVLICRFWVSGPVSADQNCGLPRVCPPNHFALRLTSGAANVVGPQICFEGKMCVTDVQKRKSFRNRGMQKIKKIRPKLVFFLTAS